MGPPIELFEKPGRIFQQFIGSAGMNILPCSIEGGKAVVAGTAIETANGSAYRDQGKRLELGVRPEFVSFGNGGIPSKS